MSRAAAVGLVMLLGAAGCAVDDADDAGPSGEITVATAPDAPDVQARYDFDCHGKTLPERADDPVFVDGFANDSYSGGPLDGVTVDVLATADDTVLATTSTDATGGVSFEIATHNAPLAHYSRMTRPGHVTSYLYPSGPLWRDESGRGHPVLDPQWRAELAGYANVTLDDAKGIVAVVVTDCDGKRVEGASVTFEPAAEAVAYWDMTFTDPAGGAPGVTGSNGHAWGFNIPAGTVHATVSVNGLTYRDWPVQSFADSRTISWRAP